MKKFEITDEELDRLIHEPEFTIDFQHIIYKIGAHGFVYRWAPNYEYWVRSDMTKSGLRCHLREKLERTQTLSYE